jgi:hypothetical protein
VLDAVAVLQARFEVPHEQLATDFAAFRADCEARGWLAGCATENRPPPGPVIFPVVTACMHILGVRRRLKRGFAAAYDWAIERAPAVPDAVDARRLAKAEGAFRSAEALLPNAGAPDDCLPRSLALFAFLRRMRLPAEHHIGVERMPFGAHAWVECGNRVILDGDRRSELVVLAAAPT